MKTKPGASAKYVTMPRKHQGFTLIELLVVIGLIAVLAAGIGLSMRDGNPSASLRAGQNSLVGLLSSARGQAALNQTDAMLVVDVTDITNDQCLRAFQIVVRAGSGLDQWRPVGDPVLLPQGIYLAPPEGTSITGLSFDGGWTAARKSKGFQSTAPGTLTERSYSATDYPYYPTGAFTGRSYLKFQSFSALGTTSGAGTLLVTAGKRKGAAEISLDNPELLRGVWVSRYGVATLINEAGTFDNVTIP